MLIRSKSNLDRMLQPGRRIGGKYVVEDLLGSGIEGEVYKVREIRTDILRAAKVFFPVTGQKERISTWHAKKLDKLRHCTSVLQYLNVETVKVRRTNVSCLISEYLDGTLLSDLLAGLPGKRLTSFEALHLTYAICRGLQEVHLSQEYHGDLHSSNIFVKRRGIFFDVKFIDFYHRGRATSAERQSDVIDVIHLLYEMVGGRKNYAKQPPEIKAICLGLRRDLILRRYSKVERLVKHIESFEI